jgi:macrolide transport system ATP-binding/permease protein
MILHHINFNNVSFTYETLTKSLFKNISLHCSTGWSGVVGVNGAGKTTLLKIAAGILKPDTGIVTETFNPIYCEQRTDHCPALFKDFIVSETSQVFRIKNKLKIQDNWLNRWDTLSHGERKKIQIAVALWQNPDLLAIDEPTNHIDSTTKTFVISTLKSYKGVGMIISHDRELLDTLCYQCIFIEPPEVTVRSGGITQAMEAVNKEENFIQKQLQAKKKIYKKLKHEEKRRKDLAQKSNNKRSKKGIAKKDHDARDKKDRARITGKDAVAGKLQKQLNGRMKKIEHELSDLQFKKQYKTGIWLPGSRSKRNYILSLTENDIELGKDKLLHYPDLSISPVDRIALTGDNGTGKSTLINHIADHLNVPKLNITYIPQEINISDSKYILSGLKQLPNDKKGHLMTIVSCLGSSPERLLDSIEPSPGELRKLMLALGMTYEPHIIVMDEPTNHMDLTSIQCLEDALIDCPCALLLVSHDRHFLGKLTIKEWNITTHKEGKEYKVIL